MDSKNKTQKGNKDAEQVKPEEYAPLLLEDQREMLARAAAMNVQISDEDAQGLARLIFATAALTKGQSIARITLKIHDMDEQDGRLRDHGKFGICLACIKVDTQFGHRCISISPGQVTTMCCLHPDTNVQMESGVMKRAADLAVGSQVVAFDAVTEQAEPAVVTRIFKHHKRNDYFILNEEIRLTDDHPVAVVSSSGITFKPVVDLVEGTDVMTIHGIRKISSLVQVQEPIDSVYLETDKGTLVAGRAGIVLSALYASTFDLAMLENEQLLSV